MVMSKIMQYQVILIPVYNPSYTTISLTILSHLRKLLIPNKLLIIHSSSLIEQIYNLNESGYFRSKYENTQLMA